MRDQFLELYQRHHSAFKSVLEQHPGEDMAGPHLISPNALYEKQPYRLLIIGQETGGWSYHVEDLERQMKEYEMFNLGEHYYPSPFWNITRKVERILGNEPYSCAWANVSKFDHNNGRASGKVEASIASLDWLLREEIAILQPAVCLFYTGPAFDHRVRGIFPGVEYEEVAGQASRQMARLRHPDLPHHSYRSYHPNYLRQQGHEQRFLNTIQEVVTNGG